MDIEKLYSEISMYRSLDERTSYPLFLKDKNMIFWFNYTYDLEAITCHATNGFFCDINLEKVTAINLDLTEELVPCSILNESVDEEEYYNLFTQITNDTEALELIVQTEEYTFSNLYVRVLEYLKAVI